MNKKLMPILTAGAMLASLAAVPANAESEVRYIIPERAVCSIAYAEDGTPEYYYLLDKDKNDIYSLQYDTMMNLLTEDSRMPEVGDVLKCHTVDADTVETSVTITDAAFPDGAASSGKQYIENLGSAMDLYGELYCQKVASKYSLLRYGNMPESEYFVLDEDYEYDKSDFYWYEEGSVCCVKYHSDSTEPLGYFIAARGSKRMFYISYTEMKQQLEENEEMPVVGDVLRMYLYEMAESTPALPFFAEESGCIENLGNDLKLYGEEYEAKRLEYAHYYFERNAEWIEEDFCIRIDAPITPNSGDSNLDGNMTIVDVVKTCCCAMGADEVPAIGVLAGDINEDGVLDATDASITIRSLVGLE